MLFFRQYLEARFGKALFRVPIDPPFPCPHRVSNHGAGCLFCADDGARARHLRSNLDVPEQISRGVEYVRRRYGRDSGLIAYFQSFTPTNGPVEELRRFYSEALALADFDMVVVATRPDCLPPEVLLFLRELNEEIPLWVELGVQTSNDATLAAMNRAHDFQSVVDASAALASAGVRSAAHVILGLPGEGPDDFRGTADAISALPFSAIKIHNLLVLRKTPLAAELERQRRGNGTPGFPEIRPMNEYEYADVLSIFLRHIPKEWPIMRLVADAPPEQIVAPKWWMSKGQFLEYFKERFGGGSTMDGVVGMPEVATGDGSPTLYHPAYKQHFHSVAGAATETRVKFLEPADIAGRLETTGNVRILDVGFGLGLNALSAAALAESTGKGRVEIVSLENDSRALQAALMLARGGAWELDGLDNPVGVIASLIESGSAVGKRFAVSFVVGDARVTAADTTPGFDAIFLDPFSIDVNPELWTYDFIRLLASKLSGEGVIVTYSSAAPVRGAMIRSGLHVGSTTPFGRRRGGTIASKRRGNVETPLSDKEKRIVTMSTAGLPYRDMGLCWARSRIRNFHTAGVARLRKAGVRKWAD